MAFFSLSVQHNERLSVSKTHCVKNDRDCCLQGRTVGGREGGGVTVDYKLKKTAGVGLLKQGLTKCCCH